MNGIKDDSEDSLVEQLYVPILHVLFMFAHGSLSLLLAGEHGLCVAGWPAVRKILEHHVYTVRHRTEPLQ